MWGNISLMFDPIVLPFTVLLGFVLLYWLLVITGSLGMEIFDVDWDVEAEADFDGDAGVDGGSGDSFMIQSLKFFHVGEVPIMIIATCFSITMWASVYLSNYYLTDENTKIWFSLLMLGPCLLFSLLVTRFALLPVRSLFRSLNQAEAARTKIVGKICLITSSEVTEEFGQAEIPQDGPTIVLHVRAKKGEGLRKGDAALVDSYLEESNTYLVVRNRPEVKKS